MQEPQESRDVRKLPLHGAENVVLVQDVESASKRFKEHVGTDWCSKLLQVGPTRLKKFEGLDGGKEPSKLGFLVTD